MLGAQSANKKFRRLLDLQKRPFGAKAPILATLPKDKDRDAKMRKNSQSADCLLCRVCFWQISGPGGWSASVPETE